MADHRPPGTPDDTDIPALILGRYRVEAALGQGAFGDVVRAFDTRIRRPVAIKTLRPALAIRYPDRFEGLRERFVREAEAASRMGIHPHVVAVHDLAADADGTLFLILEYLPGGTLAERIARGAAAAPEALRLVADAAYGLDAAHRHGIVHRDVKPANLFLTAEGRVKVGDFGVAQIDDLSQRSGLSSEHPGTPVYMSPEQMHETGYLGPVSDEYALGLVLFELLTGEKYKLLQPVNADALVRLQSPPIVALLRGMTAELPGARYYSLGAVADTIAAMLPEVEWRQQGGVHPAPPVPPVAEPQRVSRRAVLAGIGGVIVVGGVAAGVWAKQHTGGGGDATVNAIIPPSLPRATSTTAATVVPTPSAGAATAPRPSLPATATPAGSRLPTSTVFGPSTTPTPEGVTVTPNNIIIPTTSSTGTVTFTNRGAAAVTLTRTEQSTDYAVDPNQVTIRPSESAIITVTIDRTRLVAGRQYVFSVTFAPTNGAPVNIRLAFQG